MVMTRGWFSWHWVYHITIHGNMFGILYMHMELWYHNWTYHFDMNGGFISSWGVDHEVTIVILDAEKTDEFSIDYGTSHYNQALGDFFQRARGLKNQHIFRAWLQHVVASCDLFSCCCFVPTHFYRSFLVRPWHLGCEGVRNGSRLRYSAIRFLHWKSSVGCWMAPERPCLLFWCLDLYDLYGRGKRHHGFVFSRMRSKGSRFTLGGLGVEGVFARRCVRERNRSQPSATVRSDPRMAVPMGSSAEVVLFGGFRRLVASFRVAGVALRDIQTCSATCRKSFCVAGAILLRRFQKMCCSFRGRRSTLGVSIVIFRGRRSTLDVSFCVFFVNRIGRAASSGDKVQIPWQAWHFLTCVENWRKPRTKHRFWGYKFSGSKENS